MTMEKFGRYEIVKELGRGGMAVVYLGYDPLIKRQVAIKVLTSQLTVDPNFEERFRREAETIAALEHSCIVPIYDFGRHEEKSFIVMQFMAGGSLETRLEQGAMKLQELAPVVERVASALDAAHAKNIIHRDIKPANIMFNGQGEAMLSDFGIAKTMGGPSGLTADDTFIGTVEYMSPEQIQGKGISARTDIYALGIVLYRMITGVLPFKKDTIISTVMAHLIDPVPSVQGIVSGSRMPWDEVLGKALAKNPDDRYQTAGELANDVKSLLSGRWYLNKIAG